MVITEKHKMKDYARLGSIINLDKDFLDKVKKYDIPKKIGKFVVRDRYKIQLQHICQAWNIKNEQKLLEVTAKAYGLDKDKINDYPLIDFTRLTIDLQDIAEESAELFSKLKRENKDPQIQAVLDKFSTTNLGIIDRFVLRSNGAYTHDQAAECGWYIVYEAFKSDTDKYDIDVKINEIMEEKHGRK